MFYIKIPSSKTNVPRTFTISNVDGMDFMEIVRNYLKLRPKNCPTERLFLKYVNGKCYSQPVGKNTFAKIPNDIACFLNLPDPKNFTGHCFRRSSATLLANSGCDILELKRLGGWKSATVAEGYIDDSIANKISTSKKLFADNNTHAKPSTSTSNQISNLISANYTATTTTTSNQINFTCDDPVDLNIQQDKIADNCMVGAACLNNENNENNQTINKEISPAGCGINIQNCTNCSFTFHYSKN